MVSNPSRKQWGQIASPRRSEQQPRWLYFLEMLSKFSMTTMLVLLIRMLLEKRNNV
jgi:hypothetical protein